MPQLMDLQKRLNRRSRAQVRTGSEEVLIADVRGQMRPGDFVEAKLRALNREAVAPVASVASPASEVPQYARRPR